MISIEDILKFDDSHSQVVKIPEWGDEEITVCSMTARERADLEAKWSQQRAGKDPAAFRVDLLSKAIKRDGQPWGTPEQMQQLLDKNAAAVERLFECACRVNGFTGKDVEELEKN